MSKIGQHVLDQQMLEDTEYSLALPAIPPLHILNKEFKYVCAAETDIRETFKRHGFVSKTP